MAEEGAVGIRDMVVANAVLAAIAYVIIGREVLLVQIPFRAVGRGMAPGPPITWERAAVVGINGMLNRRVQLFLGDMVGVNPGDLTAIPRV